MSFPVVALPARQGLCCALALRWGATFVARSFSGDKKQLSAILKAAIAHNGLSLIDVISKSGGSGGSEDVGCVGQPRQRASTTPAATKATAKAPVRSRQTFFDEPRICSLARRRSSARRLLRFIGLGRTKGTCSIPRSLVKSSISRPHSA